MFVSNNVILIKIFVQNNAKIHAKTIEIHTNMPTSLPMPLSFPQRILALRMGKRRFRSTLHFVFECIYAAKMPATSIKLYLRHKK